MLPAIICGGVDFSFLVQALTQQRARPDLGLDLLPGGVPPAEGRYLAVLPVPDPARLRRAAAAANGWRHVSDTPRGILADLRAGRAVLLLDHCNGGLPFQPDLFEELHAWVQAEDLPAGRVILVTQNAALERTARAEAGMRANLLGHACFNRSVRLVAHLFSPQAETPLLGHDADAAAAMLLDPAGKRHSFLCLNATPRLHRVLVLAGLRRHGLLEDALISFPGMDYPKAGASREEVLAFADMHPALADWREDVLAVMAMAPRKADAFAETGNELRTRIDPHCYARSCFSLVTEADFSAGRIDRITEKTVKALALGHPVVIAGNPGAMRHAARLGFAAFPTMGEAPDAILPRDERLLAVVAEADRQAALIRADRPAWLAATRAASAQNIRHAVSGGLLDACADLYDRPLLERCARLLDA